MTLIQFPREEEIISIINFFLKLRKKITLNVYRYLILNFQKVSKKQLKNFNKNLVSVHQLIWIH